MSVYKNIPEVSFLKFLKHGSRILKNPLPFHERNFERLGDTFKLKIGLGNYVIFSRDPKLAQHILQKNQKNYHKSPIQTKDLAKYVGNGLLTTNGEQWARQRKMIQPAFHKKQLALLLDTMQTAISTEVDNITTEKPIDVFPIFNDLAFQTVVKSLFSSEVGQQEINRLQYITEAAQKMLVRELRQPFKVWWFRWSGQIQAHLKLTEEAREILNKVVEKRKASGKREDDLLDMLLDTRYDDYSEMDTRQLLDEILILFTAGHETTSNALTFTCELLARHPKEQEKIYEEVKTNAHLKNDLMAFLQASPYTAQVIEEAMRLYPPAYFIDRISLEEDKCNGMIIPKNASILLSVYEIQRHENYWKNPLQFDPNRFSTLETKKSIAYYPFGAGPRKCIGNNFAMYEMVLAIAEVVSRFKIKPTNNSIEILPLITLKPKNAVLKFEQRSTA
ncbi:cytochrome P450 [Mesonia ostreae]|uniref:Cytochrome P450 n=1 Tax=Mesonia ostreae TaxID=861110 RepID=A0ABU2KFG7_9FLAO|nr:cytochrome P450 [Mesonia ostreae]MDT0293443.1 cytochrome P450 [Mesonia ostreae]